jgi:hypothetical protein
LSIVQYTKYTFVKKRFLPDCTIYLCMDVTAQYIMVKKLVYLVKYRRHYEGKATKKKDLDNRGIRSLEYGSRH